jgi:protein ImuB
MLWLALYLPELPLQVYHDDGQIPFALSETDAGRERLARCNRKAREQGLYPGMPLASALALCGTLRARPRNRQAEQTLLEDLAQRAYRFSDRISFDPLTLLLEIGASLRLMGGLERLLQQVLADLQTTQPHARHAVAPTPGAAALLARCRPGARVLRREQIAGTIGDLPLACLTRDPHARRLIRDIGLRTLNDCLGLPRDGLARRSGPELLRRIDQTLGRTPDPRPCWRPRVRFQQRLELLDGVTQAPALQFPAQRLIERLCHWLRARDAATQRLQWRLTHPNRTETRFDTGLLEPSRDPDRLLRGLREHCERLVLPDAVTTLSLRVEDCLPLRAGAHDLFDTRPDRDRQLLERLYNRLGRQRVHGLRCHPDHRPERAWQWCRPGEDGTTPPPKGPLPLWLLARPRPLPPPSHLLGRARRIESGWWDGQDVARDYFVARDTDGTRLWVYFDRRARRWYLHGYFD